MNRQRTFSIRSILLSIISLLTLLIALLAVQEVYLKWQRLIKIHSLKQATLLGDKLFDAAAILAIERDITYFILHAPSGTNLQELRLRLEDSRSQSDAVLQATLPLIKQYNFEGLKTLFEQSETHYNTIQNLRRHIDHALTIPLVKRDTSLARQWFIEKNAAITLTQDLWIGFVRHFYEVDPIVALHMQMKHLLGMILDYTGRERSLIGKLIVKNVSPTPEEQALLLNWQGRLAMGWDRGLILVNQSNLDAVLAPYIRDAQSHYMTLYNMVRDSFYVPGAQLKGSYPISIALWFELSTQTTDSLYALKNAALKETQRYVARLETEEQRIIMMHLVILLCALALCYYSFRLITERVIMPINAMVNALMDATQGRDVSFPTTQNQQDEIGKLVQVLHIFQQNMEEIKRTSLTLARYTKDLERSNKELDDFAYIASHDLKEPLRGIHNHSRFLLEDNEKLLAEDSVHRLKRLIYLSQRMEKLVNDLLYFSRLGRLDLAVQTTNMNEVIYDIESTLDVMLEEHNAQLIVLSTLPTITCDKLRVTEAFRNLITNAIKYNDKPKKIIEIGYLEEHNGVREVFFVKDNGHGIASEFYEEVFRIFKRLHTSNNKEEDGTGVGLTFVKKIIERHGGKIWLTSQLGEGTVFYFTLKEQHRDPGT